MAGAAYTQSELGTRQHGYVFTPQSSFLSQYYYVYWLYNILYICSHPLLLPVQKWEKVPELLELEPYLTTNRDSFQ